jgi:hypothetical protein
MDIKEYILQLKGRGNYKAFGEKVGISAQYLWILCQKKIQPSIFLAERIQKETGNLVTVKELIGREITEEERPKCCPYCKTKFPKPVDNNELL